MIRRSGTSLIPPSTKGYKQSIGSVCSPHMAMRETCPHEKLWVFQTVWWAKLKHDEYIRLDLLVTWGHEVVISLIQYLSFVLKLFGSHRHGHSGCSSHFFGSDTEKHVPCSICFWWIMLSQVVKSLHLFTRVNGWWPNFLDRVAAPRLCRGHEYCDKEHPVVPAVIG